MLETTFLGHQGWQFATSRARILVDSLLVETFGHGGGVGDIFPPRRFDIAAAPPVDAVIFTHEHEDHFNIPSINRLSRAIPVFIPERASSAMRQILVEAGFKVSLLSAGQVLEIGDLRFTCFSADQVRHDEQDEWETLPFLVQDLKDGGSFFSTVDVAASASIEAQLRQRGVTPGLWGYANNVMNLSFQERPPGLAPAVLPIAARFLADHTRRPSPAIASLLCGGGFSFTGPRAWMNNVFFPLDSDRLAAGLETVSPGERFIAVSPGMKITVDATRIMSKEDSSPFLTAQPRESWPDRTYHPGTVPPNGVSTATGRTELAKGELEELTSLLGDFADFLYGSPLFRALYSLTSAQLPPRVQPKFAIAAFSGDADHVFEYDPSGRTFTLSRQPGGLEGYAAGIECHATDLLDFLRGRLAPSALMFGRISRWRSSGENTTNAIDQAFWSYGHPLRRQPQYLELYRSLLAKEPKEAPRIRHRSEVA